MRLLLPLFFLFLAITATAQDELQDPDEDRWYDDWTIQPILGVQSWATYTFGHEDYDGDSRAYVPADNRLNFMMRRIRFGSIARVGDRLLIKFLGAVDFVGSDQRAGTVGGVNNGGFPSAQIWDVYSQFRISKNTEGLYVVGGYIRPPIGRESMSGALGVSSFEKAWSQWYVRQHLVGTGPGGAGGAYLGGLLPLAKRVHLDYRAGVYNASNNGISAGRLASPLFVGRFNVMVGDPENVKWTYGLPGANSFGKRRTAALALNLASEGPSDAATGGVGLVGVDGLLNFGHFHAEGEYHRLLRSTAGGEEYNSSTYAIRVGYNIEVGGMAGAAPQYIEPTVLYYGFAGATDAAEYPTVVATSYFGGTEDVFDVGINYHVKPGKIRLGLHYVGRSGELGDLPPDGRLAWHFMQGGLGGIIRGDYLGFEAIVSY